MWDELVVWNTPKASEHIEVPHPGTYEGFLEDALEEAIFDTLEGHIACLFEEIEEKAPGLPPVMSSAELAETLDKARFDYARGWKEITEIWLRVIVDRLQQRAGTRLYIFPDRLLVDGPQTLFLCKTWQEDLLTLFGLAHPRELSLVVADDCGEDTHRVTRKSDWRRWGTPSYWDSHRRGLIMDAILIQITGTDGCYEAMSEIWHDAQEQVSEKLMRVGEGVWSCVADHVHEQIPNAFREEDREAVREALLMIER